MNKKKVASAQVQGRKVLLADPDSKIRNRLLNSLEKEGYTVQCSSNGTSTLKYLWNWEPHILIFSMDLKDFNVPEIIKKVRKKEMYTAIIILGESENPICIVNGLQFGADDVLCKPYHCEELIARVEKRFEFCNLRNELSRANMKLSELVEVDDLTGLYNMRSMYRRIEDELVRSRRYGRPLSILMGDLDHFKLVNDTNDHLFGSSVLKQVGHLLAENMREVDFAARYGGDEYLVVLPETDEDGARTVAERFRASIESTEFVDGKNRTSITVSFGFSVSTPNSSIGAKELVREADHALYEAKNRGRNQVVSYSLFKKNKTVA